MDVEADPLFSVVTNCGPTVNESTSNRLILLVDDYDDIQTVISLSFEQFGYRVIAVGDGASALAMVENNRFDLAIIDFGLPDFDGIELGARLRELPNGKQLPLFLFSGRHHTELAERAKAVGFAACILKPVRMEKLLETVQSSLDG